MYHVSARGCGLPHQCLATAGALPSSACHCEERSDVAIRTPAAAHSGELRLRQIRKASRIRPNCCHLARFLCGENGLPHQCAHWFAMTCKRRMRVCGCKNVGRNDMLKTVACQRLQGRFPAVHRQCPGIVRTGGKFLHVIARSEATWQSALLRQSTAKGSA